jgi:hypothetical protein
MGVVFAILLAGQSAAGMIAVYEDKTRGDARCAAPAGNDVVVCGRRTADRYRVPLIEHDAGDPYHEGVPAERERLLARTNNCQEHSTFLVGCGMAGVSVSSSHGVTLEGERPLAP